MAQKPGRVGVDPDQVDEFGQIISEDVSFQDLVTYKIKLDESLLEASSFSDFKSKMSE